MAKLSSMDLLCNLQKCNKVHAKHVHVHMSSNGVDAHRAPLSDHLVPVFSGSKSMNNDDRDSYKLLPCNNYSWDSAIHELTAHGQPQQALNLFEEMQAAHGHLNRHTLQALLRACGRLKCLERGRKLHDVVTKAAFDSDHYVGSTLVDMYGKCGHLAEAQEVFDKLQIRDVVLWTSLIAAYAEHGYSVKALTCLKQMQLEGVLPNPVTFVCSLKACGSMGAIDKGRGIHSEIVRQGYEGVLIVGSALVDMYAKCLSLTEAREVLDQLPGADAVSWTALMVRYAEHGFGGETLNCLESMQKKGMPLDAVTFLCSLKACGATGAIGRGREIHAEIAREGWESNLSVCNTLVDMYAKCGSLEEAKEVFDELPVRDVVSWNALISGYAEHGLGLEAINCLKQMQLMGVSPGAVTFVCSLKAIGSIDRGQEIHMEISKEGFERNIVVGSALVDMYAKFSLFAEALKLFDELSVQNAVSWTALIAGYADQGLGEEALHLLDKMVSEGVPVDVVTIVCSLKACGSMKAIARGREIHAKIAIEGFERDPSIGSMLVDMYARCGSLLDAGEVFDKLPTQRMASWNSLIAGYAEHGFGEEAVECLGMMQLEGMSMDAVTFACSLKACGSIGALDKGRELHAKIAKEGLERDTVVGNTLVDLYAKCGSVAEAQEVFDKLPICNTVSWTALITGYACQGESEHVFHLFEIMRKEGIQPDKVTFLSLLTVCSHVGLVEKGQEYFDAMCAGYGISPDADHLDCMVDLFGRAGQLNKVSLILDKMPFQPNLSTWHSVLGACRKWGDVELGKAAFEGALKLDENQAAAFILMFNIYADAHMWEDMKMVESMRAQPYQLGKSSEIHLDL